MSKTIIKVENLSKQYRLGELGTGTISHDLNRWWHKVRGKEDPYLKVGEINDRTTKSTSDYAWALRDINFEVKQGDVVGIIGKNGAGKSTLLKLLSRVTSPTTGVIKAKGRIASLLEVGTGFHEELTGRDNIFLNGSILGMTKAEIRAKFDEIVAFSGTERYIDTPVKRYSSGMRVRLAFAVAAHLEPEILIVDEVLAVGDVEFQNKAIGKMKEVSSGQGRTVLFVSHNMAAVQNLCTRGIVLKNGTVALDSVTASGAVDYYIKENSSATKINSISLREHKNRYRLLSPDPVFDYIKTVNTRGEITNVFKSSESIIFEIGVIESQKVAAIRLDIDDDREVRIMNIWSDQIMPTYLNSDGAKVYRIEIKNHKLAPRTYTLKVLSAVQINPVMDIDQIYDVISFEIVDDENIRAVNYSVKPTFYPNVEISTI